MVNDKDFEVAATCSYLCCSRGRCPASICLWMTLCRRKFTEISDRRVEEAGRTEIHPGRYVN
jgi:hypothetical protein